MTDAATTPVATVEAPVSTVDATPEPKCDAVTDARVSCLERQVQFLLVRIMGENNGIE